MNTLAAWLHISVHDLFSIPLAMLLGYWRGYQRCKEEWLAWKKLDATGWLELIHELNNDIEKWRLRAMKWPC